MEPERVETEVRRLAPWYYLFELGATRTDCTAPFDHWGHRRPQVVVPRPGFWTGRSVLDLGCNEGGLAYSALQLGAAAVHGVEIRPANVEKARFVGRALGVTGATFEIADVRDWLATHGNHRFDVVLLCGLLYHLPRPWEVLRMASALAAESVVVNSVLAGGGEGYSPFEESESIGASANPDERSSMPNTALSIADELVRCGLSPSLISEHRVDDASIWGGGVVVAERVHPIERLERRRERLGDIGLGVYPAVVRRAAAVPQLAVLLYDRAGRDRDVVVEVSPLGSQSSSERQTCTLEVSARPSDTSPAGATVESTTASFPLEWSTRRQVCLRIVGSGDADVLYDRAFEIRL